MRARVSSLTTVRSWLRPTSGTEASARGVGYVLSVNRDATKSIHAKAIQLDVHDLIKCIAMSLLLTGEAEQSVARGLSVDMTLLPPGVHANAPPLEQFTIHADPATGKLSSIGLSVRLSRLGG